MKNWMKDSRKKTTEEKEQKKRKEESGQKSEEKRGLSSFMSAHNDADDLSENIVSDITQLIGWTPLIELKSIAKEEGIDARIVAKLETYQPLSSVKDRTALRMIEDAERKGLIRPGITTLAEPTSGNLGIALAYVAMRKGYKFHAIMPTHYSVERRMLLKYLGADLSVTDNVYGRLDQLKAKDRNVHCLDQFSNPANPEVHFTSTGPEIWKDTGGKVDIFVCASGSGGTLSGTGKYLKKKNPAVKIICVEPAESPVISGGYAGAHNIQGISPGFVPKNLDRSCIDEIITVTTEQSMIYARRIAKEEGLLVGISSGANLAACVKLAKRAENRGKMIVTVFSSGAERYMSTELFDEVREECENMGSH